MIDYNPAQLAAISTALTANVSVITGGPGTGKTTVLRGIIDKMEAKRLRYKLCAPTGRAQKRMTEQTHRPSRAVTIQPVDPLYQGEEITMLLMPMLVND